MAVSNGSVNKKDLNRKQPSLPYVRGYILLRKYPFNIMVILIFPREIIRILKKVVKPMSSNYRDRFQYFSTGDIALQDNRYTVSDVCDRYVLNI